MTVKQIKKKYKNYRCEGNEHNTFISHDFNDGNGPVVIVVNVNKYIGKYVLQVVRLQDGKELLNDACRACTNTADAIEKAEGMLKCL